MRICLVAVNRFLHDPRATALAFSLHSAGHEVQVVALTPSRPPPPLAAEPPPPLAGEGWGGGLGGALTFVSSRWPSGPGKLAALLRRLQPEAVRRLTRDLRLAGAARRTRSALYYPTSPDSLRAARWAAGRTSAVVRVPDWPSPGPRDLAWLAPEHPHLSLPAGADPPRFHVGGPQPPPPLPRPGRHRSHKLVLCYRRTERSPGRYLEAALLRAGVELSVTDTLRWEEVDPATRGVLFVESPLPPISVSGHNPGVAVAFWVHHGEHHLPANLRLARRYGAHLVLLAHSWHLAHRFDVPVERLPFAVAPELFSGGLPFEERPYEVAFVGAHLGSGGPYTGRQELLRRVEEAWPGDRISFREDVPPGEVAATYGRAKVVLNEGGSRHFPITMRVFEAVGSGALLLTEPAPGLPLLFSTGEHYQVLQGDPVAALRSILADPDRAAAIAAAAHRHALERHTYDHRVDELLEALLDLDPEPRPAPTRPSHRLAALVDDDPEVQRLIAFPAEELRRQLPDREVWSLEQASRRLQPGSYDAVVLGSNPGPILQELLVAPRRYVYADGAISTEVRERLPDVHPQAEVRLLEGGLLRADLLAESYRVTT